MERCCNPATRRVITFTQMTVAESGRLVGLSTQIDTAHTKRCTFLWILGAVLALPALAADSGAGLNRRDVEGGTPTSVFERPSAVLLVINATPSRTCTGTLAADEWVLTAAHCVDAVPVGENSWESELIVVQGYPTVTEIHHAVQTAMHEEYDPLEGYEDWEHDIALVRMNEKFLSRTAAVIDLADPEDSIFLQPGTTTSAVGWGGENVFSMTEAIWPLAVGPISASSHLCRRRDNQTWGNSSSPVIGKSSRRAVARLGNAHSNSRTRRLL